jgi:hypothetical protein
MPTLYVTGKMAFEIEVPKDYDNIYKGWTSKKLAAERKKYNHPSVTLWLEMKNDEDPISPLVVVVGDDNIYEGELRVEQKGRTFKFIFDGKAKTFVHKMTKDELDKGRIPLLNSVSINGVGMSIDAREITLQLQSKKPK